ncbi:MAG: matrixin family metalloprotease [Planctomycetales bacterium]|nr:matrixin family metalloprotease [Planctomycetales bacterium]
MKTSARLTFVVTLAVSWFSMLGATSRADLTLCGTPQPISYQIDVHTVQTFLDNGTDPASLGSARVYDLVDQIYGQLGIDVQFDFGTTWNNTFAHQGISTLGQRPASDTFTILSSAVTAGKTAPTVNTINMILVDIVPSFFQLSSTGAAGTSVFGGNGIVMFVGADVGLFASSEETAAIIMAHQIGHNLGLDHSTDTNNLMTALVSGGCFNESQAAQILANAPGFLTAVPEPSALLLLAVCGVLLSATRLHSVCKLNAKTISTPY